MAKQFWTQREGQTWGPFTGQQLKELAEQGRLAPSDLVSLDQKRWTPATLIPGLFDAGEPAAPEPAAPTGEAIAAKRKSRKGIYILIGAVLVAAIVGLVACWKWLAGPDEEVIAALKYAPAGTVGVVHVDVRVLAEEVFREFRRREANLRQEEWNSLERASSKVEAVDIFLVAGEGEQPQPFVVVRGNLKPKDIQDAAKLAGRVPPLREVGGGQYEVPIEGERIRVIFGGEAEGVPAGVILAGPAALLTSEGVRGLGDGDQDRLRELLEEVDGSAPIWAGVEWPEGLDNDAPQTIAGHLDPREGGAVRVRMGLSSKESAATAAGQIKQLLEVARSPAKRVFRVRQSGGVVMIAGSSKGGLIPRLVDFLPTAFSGRSQQAKVTAAQTDIANLELAIDTFEIDCARYPTAEEGIQALVQQPSNLPEWRGPYLKRGAPKDPWGNPYVYRCPGQRDPEGYDLCSFGPDGQEGGGDDIGNWSER